MLGPLSSFPRGARAASVALSLFVLSACGVTTDALGENPENPDPVDPPAREFYPLVGPPAYTNVFSALLDVSEEAIHDKIERTFFTLFFGDDAEERIYYPEAGGQAEILDTYHLDVRTEGIGYGMMIAVQLDRQEIFDRLWLYAKRKLAYSADGPYAGYFKSPSCATTEPLVWDDCPDPFGHQQFAMSLIFAHNRWGHRPNSGDYAADARALLEVMRNKKVATDGDRRVTPMFDPERKLVYHVPISTYSRITRPSIEMPAYYELWGQATGDDFWYQAAAAARAHWKLATHPMTGLAPARADFDGNPVMDFAVYNPESYRFHVNLAIDHIWFSPDQWHVDISNQVLRFFFTEGIETYGTSYELSGKPVVPLREPALVLVNGITAGTSSIGTRAEFVREVWNHEVESGKTRYYQGLMKLLGLLILSGRFQVY